MPYGPNFSFKVSPQLRDSLYRCRTALGIELRKIIPEWKTTILPACEAYAQTPLEEILGLDDGAYFNKADHQRAADKLSALIVASETLDQLLRGNADHPAYHATNPINYFATLQKYANEGFISRVGENDSLSEIFGRHGNEIDSITSHCREAAKKERDGR